MRTVHFEDPDELLSYVASLGTDVLFRGQCEHHTLLNGSVSLMPSQLRKGCIPPLMLKWSYYAIDALQSMTKTDLDFDSQREVVEAVLQHYGWRSFWLDMTESPHVAAWFASHRFSEMKMMDGCEDCGENFVMLRRQSASYNLAAGIGHMYVVSKAALVKARLKSIKLSDKLQADFRTRFAAQAAWLIGPIHAPLEEDCVIAHIEAPVAVFDDLARRAGHTDTLTMFPRRTEDAFFRILLSVPWNFVPISSTHPDWGFYVSSLPIPEYDYEFQKFRDPSNAFFREFWIADKRPQGDALSRALFYRVPESAFYAWPQQGDHEMPTIAALLLDHEDISIESSGLIRMAERDDAMEYMKGINVRRVVGDVVEVSALILDHPGTVVQGVAVNRGWFYKISSTGAWTRENHPDQCPCKNGLRHRQHMWILRRFEELLRENAFTRLGPLDFTLRSSAGIPS